MFEKTTLFKKHSTGQVGTWFIRVEDVSEAFEVPTMIVESCKVVGGRPVETRTEFKEGKNIGKANETTPYQQACNEAQSKVTKQLDKGYVKTQEEAQSQSHATNALGFAKPMLAQPIEKVKNWEFPVYVQPKMDGHRMLATVQDGEVVLYSRQGKLLSVEHIREQLQKLYDADEWDGSTKDGEVYIHGVPLSFIGSLVKKPDQDYATSLEDPRIIKKLKDGKLITKGQTTEDWSDEAKEVADFWFDLYSQYSPKDLTYYVYDVVDESEDYKGRLADSIIDLLKVDVEGNIHGRKCEHIFVTETHTVSDVERLNELHAKYLGMGYEGTIVRQGSSGYEQDKRSKSLMKKKDFQDAEFQIIGHKLGKPYIRGDKQYENPVFLLKTEDGKEFEATAMGTMYEKDALHREGVEKYYGKFLTVKYFELTPDGVPFLPIALRFREDV